MLETVSWSNGTSLGQDKMPLVCMFTVNPLRYMYVLYYSEKNDLQTNELFSSKTSKKNAMCTHKTTLLIGLTRHRQLPRSKQNNSE